jgi:transcriptional regulator with XRE-family HTH domain
MDIQKKEAKALLGSRLRAARERAHLSTDDAAEAAEVQPVAVRRWEKGTSLPSLLEFRLLLQAYGIMACDILYEENPWQLTAEQATELARAAREFSPGLRARVDLLLAMHAKGVEPVWKA